MTYAGADTITIDPAAVASDRTALELSGAIEIRSADYGNAEVEQFLSQQQYGEIPIGYRLPNRTVTYGLRINASGTVGVGTAVKQLQQKVATLQTEGGWLGRVLNPMSAGEWGAGTIFADVVGANFSLPADWLAQRTEMFVDAELSLICKPDFYGAEVTGGAGTATGDYDSLVITESSIPGDYPARTRYAFSEGGSLDRQAVVFASQSRSYGGTATNVGLAFEAEDLTAVSPAAGTAVSGAHGGTAVVNTDIGSRWTPVLTTEHSSAGHLAHSGSYRLYARCYAENDSEVRFEYSTGDAAMRRVNRTKTINACGTVPTFYIKDLGEVRIDTAATGSQRWQGAVFAYSDTDQTTFGVDKIWLAPTESLTVVKARKEPSGGDEIGFGGYDAYSGFNTESGLMNGDTSDSGDTWDTNDDTTNDDFSVGSGVATKTSTSDAASIGRFAILGSSAASQGVQADVKFNANPSGGTTRRYGVVARYVNATNLLYAGLRPTGSAVGQLQITKFIGGTPDNLDVSVSSVIFGLTDTVYTLKLVVDSDGSWRLHMGISGSEPVLWLSGQDADLASGGTLASGKAGLVDQHDVGTATTRTYDNFATWAPDTDAACFANGELEARYDGAWRETASAGYYAPAHVEGAYPRAPASGLEARSCRTLILPSAGDLEDLPDLDPDVFSVTAYHRPAYLFVPEA